MEAAAVGVVIAVLAILAYVAIDRSEPDSVSGLTIENRTDALLEVSVKSSPDAGLLSLGRFEPGSRRTLASVIDQGPRWIFVAGWRDVREEFTISREQLEEDGWTVWLPQKIADAVHDRYPPLPIGGGAPSD